MIEGVLDNIRIGRQTSDVNQFVRCAQSVDVRLLRAKKTFYLHFVQTVAVCSENAALELLN